MIYHVCCCLFTQDPFFPRGHFGSAALFDVRVDGTWKVICYFPNMQGGMGGGGDYVRRDDSHGLGCSPLYSQSLMGILVAPIIILIKNC